MSLTVRAYGGEGEVAEGGCDTDVNEILRLTVVFATDHGRTLGDVKKPFKKI